MFATILQLLGIYGIIDIMIKIAAKYTNNTQEELWKKVINYIRIELQPRKLDYNPCADESFFENFWGIFGSLYPSEWEKIKHLAEHNYQVHGYLNGENSGLPAFWFLVPLTDPCERNKIGKIGANTLRKHLLMHGITAPVLTEWRQDVNGLPLLCLFYGITPEHHEIIARMQKNTCDTTIGDLMGRPNWEDLF